jgi:hypothetical protein
MQLSISHWLITMIGPRGLLLVVPPVFQIYWWGCQNKTAQLRHLILLSRVTYRALLAML